MIERGKSHMWGALYEAALVTAIKEATNNHRFRRLFRSSSALVDIYKMSGMEQATVLRTVEACVKRLILPLRGDNPQVDEKTMSVYNAFVNADYELPFGLPTVKMLRQLQKEGILADVAYPSYVCKLLGEFGVDWRSKHGLALPKELCKIVNASIRTVFPFDLCSVGGRVYEFSGVVGGNAKMVIEVDYGGFWQLRIRCALCDGKGGVLYFEPGYLVGAPTLWWDMICESNYACAVQDIAIICEAVNNVVVASSR